MIIKHADSQLFSCPGELNLSISDIVTHSLIELTFDFSVVRAVHSWKWPFWQLRGDGDGDGDSIRKSWEVSCKKKASTHWAFCLRPLPLVLGEKQAWPILVATHLVIDISCEDHLMILWGRSHEESLLDQYWFLHQPPAQVSQTFHTHNVHKFP